MSGAGEITTDYRPNDKIIIIPKMETNYQRQPIRKMRPSTAKLRAAKNAPTSVTMKLGRQKASLLSRRNTSTSPIDQSSQRNTAFTTTNRSSQQSRKPLTTQMGGGAVNCGSGSIAFYQRAIPYRPPSSYMQPVNSVPS